jgi:deoxyribose-phosphate aldolase
MHFLFFAGSPDAAYAVQRRTNKAARHGILNRSTSCRKSDQSDALTCLLAALLMPRSTVSHPNQIEEKQRIAAAIDHTLLKPEAAAQNIEKVCLEALQNGFASVCVNPHWVPLVARRLAGSPVKVCTVIGFPLGANQTETKLAEASLALSQGARELDMVQNVGALRSGDYSLVEQEIAKLAGLAHRHGAILKVILETSLLTTEQKVKACQIAVEAKADFVKTSTGFSSAGATVEDITLMRQTVGQSLGVKASGGIRSLAMVREMLAAGANRIGASAGVQILNELNQMESTSSPSPVGNY